MEPNEPLTELTTPELERLVREKQGWHVRSLSDGTRFIQTREGWRRSNFVRTVEDAWQSKEIRFTDTDWLDLLNGLPLYIALTEVLYSKMLEIEFGLTLSEALKRATLIAYLEHD